MTNPYWHQTAPVPPIDVFLVLFFIVLTIRIA
jgi:hypothetical protein